MFSRAQIEGAMQALPFVTWDRTARPWRADGTAYSSCGTVRGWINHRDRERDYVLLHWDSAGLSFSTSSEAHERDVHERLAAAVGREGAVRVRLWAADDRVGDVFGDQFNRYAPVEPRAGEGDPPPAQPRLFGAPHGRRYLEGA